MFEATVNHEFHAGHRLPHLPGLCTSLHGHTWRTEVTVAARTLPDTGVLVDFGKLKRAVRGWIDHHLDHGLMLGAEDMLTEMLRPHGKVFVLGVDGTIAADLYWPTVENVAVLLARATTTLLPDSTGDPAAAQVFVRRVAVRETASNAAAWEHRP